MSLKSTDEFKVVNMRKDIFESDDEYETVKASLLCIYSPITTNNNSRLELSTHEDQVLMYYQTLLSAFKQSVHKFGEQQFESAWEEIKNIDSISCLENVKNLIEKGTHIHYETQKYFDRFNIIKDQKKVESFKGQVQILLSKIVFIDPQKYLIPKREYLYQVDVGNSSQKSSYVEVDSNTQNLEWNLPHTFDFSSEDTKVILSLRHKAFLTNTKDLEFTFKISDVITTYFAMPLSKWGKNTFSFPFTFKEKDEILAQGTIDITLKFSRKKEEKEKFTHLNPHKLYSNLLKKFILLRSKKESHGNSFSQYENAILQEFAFQHCIEETFHMTDFLFVCVTSNEQVIISLGEQILEYYIKLKDKELPKEESKKFKLVEEQLPHKVHTILQNYVEHFLLRKKTSKLEYIYNIYRLFYPKENFYTEILKVAITNDYKYINNSILSSTKQQKISATTLFNISQIIKKHMVENDVLKLFPQEEEDYSTEIVLEYYQLLVSSFTTLLNIKETQDPLSVLKLCQTIGQLQGSISKFMKSKKKEFKIDLDISQTTTKYMENWLKGFNQQTHHIVKECISIDKFESIQNDNSSSLSDILKYYYELSLMIKSLNLKEKNIIEEIIKTMVQSSLEYSKLLIINFPKIQTGNFDIDLIRNLTYLNNLILMKHYITGIIEDTFHEKGYIPQYNLQTNKIQEEACEKVIDFLTSFLKEDLNETFIKNRLIPLMEKMNGILYSSIFNLISKKIYYYLSNLLKETNKDLLDEMNRYFGKGTHPRSQSGIQTLNKTRESDGDIKIIQEDEKSFPKEKLIERFKCSEGFCYLYEDKVMVERFEIDNATYDQISKVSKSKKGIRLKLNSGEKIIIYGIVNRSKVYSIINERISFFKKMTRLSKEDKKFNSLFELDELLLKSQTCRKDKILGTIYIGSKHLCWASDKNEVIKIPLISIEKMMKSNSNIINLKPLSSLTIILDTNQSYHFSFILKDVNEIYQIIIQTAMICGKVINNIVKPVFKVPFQDVIKYKDTLIPLPIVRSVQRVENSIKSKGIYRESGSLKQIEKIVSLYNKGEDPSLDSYDVNTVCSLLNHFFLETPKTCVLFPLEKDFSKEKIKIEKVSEIIQNLPEINRKILGFLIPHLNNICLNQEHNLMTERNVSVVFTPIIFKGTTSWKDIAIQQELLIFLIDNYKEILKNDITVIREKVYVSFKL